MEIICHMAMLSGDQYSRFMLKPQLTFDIVAIQDVRVTLSTDMTSYN